MAANPADANNPLLSTPVAHFAAVILTDDRILNPKEAVDMAEALVDELVSRGHLPQTPIETEEPKADDATLILQGIMLGVVKWRAYDEGDPRGVLQVGTLTNGWALETKLEKGLPKLDDTTRAELGRIVKPLLKRL